MTTRRGFLLGVFGLCLLPELVAAAPEERQFYGEWQKAKNYAYRFYFFKPTPDYKGYKKHVVIFYPTAPKYYYYYNPETEKFWGRAVVASAKTCYPLYSKLDDADQQERLKDIPESKFPKPSEPPPVPQTDVEKVNDPNAPQLKLPADEPPPAFLQANQ